MPAATARSAIILPTSLAASLLPPYLAFDQMRDRRARQVYFHHTAASLAGRLLDGRRHFVGLGVAVADFALAVADDDHGREAEPAAAFDDARAPANLHELIDQIALLLFAAALVAVAAGPSAAFTV